MLSASPTTNWLIVNRWLKSAWLMATANPTAMPMSSPRTGEPVTELPSAPPKALPSIIASTEMFSVPPRSATISPSATKRRGAASREALSRMIVMSWIIPALRVEYGYGHLVSLAPGGGPLNSRAVANRARLALTIPIDHV